MQDGRGDGETWMGTMMEQNDVDMLVTGWTRRHAGGRDPGAHHPRRPRPRRQATGHHPDRPVPVRSGAERRRLCAGKAMKGRVEPDLEATLCADRRR